MVKKVPITFLIEPENKEVLVREIAKYNLTQSQLIRNILKAHIEKVKSTL